jgi:hypothetical protein
MAEKNVWNIPCLVGGANTHSKLVRNPALKDRVWICLNCRLINYSLKCYVLEISTVEVVLSV